MRMQHPEEKIHIVGRLRNFENALVNLFIRERDAQGKFFCEEINSAQPDGELLQKSAKHAEKRRGCCNYVFKFETLLDSLRRQDQFDYSAGLSSIPLPH